jgi:hypothetical protein
MKKKKSLVLTLLSGLLFLAPASEVSLAQTEKSVRQEKSEWVFNRSENGKELRVRIKGKVEFADDYSDISSISPDGVLQIKDSRTSTTRTIEIVPIEGGGLRRSYAVNGKSNEFDAEARRWLSEVLQEVVKNSGLYAPARVKRLLAEGGADAVLREISTLGGDYVKRLYFLELFKTDAVDSTAARKAIQQVAVEMFSDYEKRQVLATIAERHGDDSAVLSELISAARTIRSDYERGQTLSAVINRPKLGPEQMAATLNAVAGMASDHDKGRLLMLCTQRHGERAATPEFFKAVATIRSDFEHSRVLLAMLSAGRPSREATMEAVRSVSAISSDHEKARVLLHIARASGSDEEIRKALVVAAREIKSEHERGRVLSATFR